MRAKYLIIGAGACGLAAANRLEELGEESYLVLEERSTVGGIFAGRKDSAGFTWDFGVHVRTESLNSSSALLEELAGGEAPVRECLESVCLGGSWVACPVPDNLASLPPQQQWEAVGGLLPDSRLDREPSSLLDRIYADFGPGLASMYLLPYLRKALARPLEELTPEPPREIDPPQGLERVLKSLILGGGARAKTVYAQPFGGMGGLFRRLAKKAGDRIVIGAKVVRIDARNRRARTAGGEDLFFDAVLSTAPLDLLVVKLLDESPEPLRRAAMDLKHSGAHFSCIGLRGVRPVPAPLMRFPDSRFTIHDAAMLSEIAPGCVPSRDKYRALVAETAFSECRPLPAEPLARAMDALVSCGVLNDNDRERVVSSLEETVEYYRPASTASRDAALRTIQPHLESLGIYSRGLFGGWKAEAGSLEQCMAQGAEWAERLLLGKTEQTYRIGEQ